MIRINGKNGSRYANTMTFPNFPKSQLNKAGNIRGFNARFNEAKRYGMAKHPTNEPNAQVRKNDPPLTSAPSATTRKTSLTMSVKLLKSL